MSTSTPVRSGAKVVTSQVEPRIVDRRRTVQLVARRKKHRIQLIVGSFIAVLAVFVGVALSPLTAVQQITISGRSAIEEPDLVSASGISMGDHLVAVDLAAARERLMGMTWVSSAHVERKWPHRLVIKVTEQRPSSIVKSGDALFLVSTTGRILRKQGAANPEMPLLELNGDLPIAQVAKPESSSNYAQGDLIGQTVSTEVSQALGVLERMPDTLRTELAAARLSQTGALSLELNDGTLVLFGPPEDVAAKLLAVESVLNQVVRDCMKTLDVREPTRAAVSRGPGCKGISPSIPSDSLTSSVSSSSKSAEPGSKSGSSTVSQPGSSSSSPDSKN